MMSNSHVDTAEFELECVGIPALPRVLLFGISNTVVVSHSHGDLELGISIQHVGIQHLYWEHEFHVDSGFEFNIV